MKSLEQQARDILERCGWDKAQQLTGCDVVEVANLLADLQTYKAACEEHGIDLSRRMKNNLEKNDERVHVLEGSDQEGPGEAGVQVPGARGVPG